MNDDQLIRCGYLIIVKTNNGIIKHKLLIALTKASIKGGQKKL